MVTFHQRGNYNKTEQMLKKAVGRNYRTILEAYARQGVSALSAATPKDTGLTAASWTYDIVIDQNGMTIEWHNTNVQKGYANIAILLQYGHGTRNGGYVQGRDYINPAIRPIFDKMANDVWKEVIGK